MGLKKKHVLVVAHDAGAAEIIAAYVRVNASKQTFVCYAAGPAVKVFRRAHVPCSRIAKGTVNAIVRKHQEAAFVLTGTGWMSGIESAVIAEAKKSGLKTVMYLDSWGDYRLRFGYPAPTWRANLPDELWVGDREALTLAKRQFPRVRIRIVPNQYTVSVIARYRKAKKDQGGVLFLSREDPGVRATFAKLIAGLSKRIPPPPVFIRFHPVQKRTYHDAVIEKYKGRVRIIKCKGNDLSHDLSRATSVVGMETPAMTISERLGITTVCIVFPYTKRLLPLRQNIIRVSNVGIVLTLI